MPKTITPLDNIELAIEWLSHSTQIPRNTVIQTLRQEAKNLGTTVRKDIENLNLPRYQWTSDLLTYYQSSKSFVFESFAWNTTKAKESLRKRVGNSLLKSLDPGSNILCYGDGLGFDSAYFSTLGFHVTYYELGQPCIQFARRVFEENNVDVKVCNDLESLRSKTFDAIVCLDVLEHVPEPTKLVEQLTHFLVDNGLFIAHAPFWYLHPCVSTHLASNVKYSGCTKKIFHANGLREVDAGFFWCPLVLEKYRSARPKTIPAALRIRFSQFFLKLSRITTWPTVMTIRTVAKARPRMDL